MKNLFRTFAVLTALLVFSISVAFAGDFAERLAKKFPQTAEAKVSSAWPGFYSVVKGDEILYFSEDLTIMISGDVIDLRRNASITNEIRQANLPKVSTNDLPIADSVKVRDGSRKLYIFADPDCFYCRKLEREFQELQDVEIRIFPFPIESIHPGVSKTTEAIWCAADRAAAWSDYLTLGKRPRDAQCANPIIRNTALAQKLRIVGTPAIIFEDGAMIQSYLPAAQINAKLASLRITQ